MGDYTQYESIADYSMARFIERDVLLWSWKVAQYNKGIPHFLRVLGFKIL